MQMGQSLEPDQSTICRERPTPGRSTSKQGILVLTRSYILNHLRLSDSNFLDLFLDAAWIQKHGRCSRVCCGALYAAGNPG